MSHSQESRITWSNLGPVLLDRAPRYLIYSLLFYAPFCYGLRNGVGESFFVSVAFVAFFLHCWKCYLDDRWPRVPAWLLFCMTLIALQGLWMCLNADSYHRWHRELITVRIFIKPPPFPDLPGSKDLFASPIQFFSQLAVCCVLIVVVDSSDIRRRKYAIAATLAIFAVAVTGLAMKVGPSDWIRIYWELENESDYRTTFGPYRYHGNTATVLTLGLSLALGFILQYSRDKRQIHRAFASAGAIILFVALYINTSRAGWLLAPVVAVMFARRFALTMTPTAAETESPKKKAIQWAIGSISVLILLVALFGADATVRGDRLSRLTDELSRRFPIDLFLTMLPETPLLGHGPGTFSFVFPKYQLASPGFFRKKVYFNEAHQDYFQLYFDWGAIAFCCWLALLFVPLIVYMRTVSRENNSPWLFGCFVATFAYLIHATIDFPSQVTSLLLFFSLLLGCLIPRTYNKKAIDQIH